MTKEQYSELLRDPRWQKKRLQIMERDNWTCRSCGWNESTLNVHHKYYLPNRLPWEYLDSNLITLCEGCHEFEEDFRYPDYNEWDRKLLDNGYLNSDIAHLFSLLLELPGGDDGIVIIHNAVNIFKNNIKNNG